MFLAYCMVFGMSLMDSPSWRLMRGVLSVPSLMYFVLVVLYLPESPRWLLFPNFGSMFSMADSHVKHEQWDEEGLQQECEDYASEADGDDYENNLHSPLLSRQATSMEKDTAHGSAISVRRHSSLMQGNVGEIGSSIGIGGGWQLAWRWSEKEGENGKKEGSFKRIYLHEETHGSLRGSMRGSLVSLPGGDVPEESEYIQAAALVSQNARHSLDLMNQHAVGPALVHPSETASKGVSWDAFLEPGVSRALVVGIGIQLLQLFSGINGVMYYTPQILEQAGVGVLLSSLGIGSESAYFLISALTTLLMLPSIDVAMRFVDVAGRRCR